jgi:hypothetical protein
VPLIASAPGRGALARDEQPRRRRLSPEERRAKFRRVEQLIVSGHSTGDALGLVGLSWDRLYRWCAHDPEIERAWHACRRFRAHVHAERVVEVAADRVETYPEAVRAKTLVGALQWSAARAAPDHYADRLDVHQSGASVVHHVVHLPDRGPRPVVVVDQATAAAMVSGGVPGNAGQYPADGDSIRALPPATGSPNRPTPSGEVAPVSPDVRTPTGEPQATHVPARLRAQRTDP